jgi:hypothetical protein
MYDHIIFSALVQHDFADGQSEDFSSLRIAILLFFIIKNKNCPVLTQDLFAVTLVFLFKRQYI